MTSLGPADIIIRSQFRVSVLLFAILQVKAIDVYVWVCILALCRGLQHGIEQDWTRRMPFAE